MHLGAHARTAAVNVPALGEWDFNLKEDGRLEVIFTCPPSHPLEKRSSGKWRIEANKLCMEDLDGLISYYVLYTRGSRHNHQDKCWRVKSGTSRFEAYVSNLTKDWEFTVFSPNLPKGIITSKLRSLKKLGDPVAGCRLTETGTPAPGVAMAAAERAGKTTTTRSSSCCFPAPRSRGRAAAMLLLSWSFDFGFYLPQRW